MSSFKEQYERVKRYLKRIQYGEQKDTTDYMDDLYSFFINCHHLKDWVKKDKSTRLTNDEVDDFVKSKLSLRICAALATASKHATLGKIRQKKNKIPQPRENAQVTSRSVNVDLDKSRVFHENTITLKDGSKHIAEKIAQQAFDDWTRFLTIKKLI